MIRAGLCLMLTFVAGLPAVAEKLLFEDNFAGKLAEGWTWVRENPEAWRVADKALEIKIEPGNMWGGSNDARNILTRPLPAIPENGVALELTVQNAPTHQYEQVNLVWYYDDSNMVKLGLELVDGQLSVVMGREEADKTRTLAIIPTTSTTLHVRITVKGQQLTGHYRFEESEEWLKAGECDVPGTGPAKASIQAYQGPPDAEHWARIWGFKVTASK